MSDFKIDQFGERLLWLIKSNQLNQTDFAHKLSASPSFVSDLIRGVKKPGTEILIRIKNNFKVSIDWLLFGEENNQEEKIINIVLFKAIAMRVDIVKAALSGNAQALTTLNSMCPSIKGQLTTKLPLSYLLDANQIAKDIDVINSLYVTYLDNQINDDLYKRIIESAVEQILESPIDPMLKINHSK